MRKLLVPSLMLLAVLTYFGVQRRANSERETASTRGTVAPAASLVNRGTFVDGDERSTWILTTAADGGMSIEEDARFGDDGRSNRVFTYDKNGTLLRATEQRSQTVQSPDRSPAPMRTEFTVDFRGDVPSLRKFVDGVPGNVQEYEVDNIRRHAEALRVHAHR